MYKLYPDVPRTLERKSHITIFRKNIQRTMVETATNYETILT